MCLALLCGSVHPPPAPPVSGLRLPAKRALGKGLIFPPCPGPPLPPGIALRPASPKPVSTGHLQLGLQGAAGCPVIPSRFCCAGGGVPSRFPALVSELSGAPRLNECGVALAQLVGEVSCGAGLSPISGWQRSRWDLPYIHPVP